MFQASRQRLDAGRFSEVVEDFRELALGKLSAVKICMDLNAVIGGACESLHDQPVGVGGQVDFMFGAIDKGHVDMLKILHRRQ